MDARQFDRIARIAARRGDRRGLLAALVALAGFAGGAAGPRPAAAGFGRPLGMACADAAQCAGLGVCGWPSAVACEADWNGEPLCCLPEAEPCNADIECCGQLSCLRADGSCAAGFCGYESAAGAGAGIGDASDAAESLGVACANGTICSGAWETCGPGVFVAGQPECCLADGAPCGGREGACCHYCVDGACMALGRGGLAALEDLNLRAGPGTEFAIIGVVPGGAIVDYLGYAENGYLLVELPWATGWALADGLSGHAG